MTDVTRERLRGMNNRHRIPVLSAIHDMANFLDDIQTMLEATQTGETPLNSHGLT